MSISEINEIRQATNYAVEYKTDKSAKEEIVNLFSTKQFYNDTASADSIQKEINTLQSYISQKNNDYEEKTNSINLANKELESLNKKLENEIKEVTQLAVKEENEQKEQIQKAIKEVNQMYMNGEIEKEEMPSELSKKISKYSSLSLGVLTKSSKLNNIKLKITSITNKIASLIDAANSLETELNLANGTLSLMENLQSKMGISGTVNSTSEDSSDKTSALGFSANGKTFNFVIDKNFDNKLNGKSEFLGSQNGFDELKEFDTNNDNVISANEIGTSNMFVLMTDNQTGSKNFMSIFESGISSIDLSTITSEDFSEIETAQTKNIFTVNTVCGAIQGYDEYEINGFDNTQMLISVDEDAIKNSENIFAKSVSLSTNGLEKNIVNAVSSVKSAQIDIKKISNEMTSNNSLASTNLTAGERPKTEEEKAEKAQQEEKEQEEKEKQEKVEFEEKEKAELKKKEEAKEAEEKQKKKEQEEKEKQ